ncbi:MarR family transcriptional regulator [Amycolatopsis acidiphila]|uniref:MarR family transcriptional regulator n=1 Tax=Amycolatopsis acidiphila TaxID=715473 RepID=A0A558AMZ1_9PSEU|nr:MarR family transcriptional regulator [Amycolatopsis acidiphila]TVT25628.1 MarR family transcriptional regulator [Amycolatopsis acidiphila]UIJ60383.1 MarR family transcriptional regulator [Amycolatopsis acidiphila]GHG90462.1 MarR family transcriptional regulator [Amycolatopsis acidiphila]
MPTDPAVHLDEAALQFVEKFGQALTDAGVPRMPSRVFAAILASPEGSLTARDMTEILRISPAAVSGAVRYLGQIQLLRRRRRPGERRDHFVVRSDYWYEMVSTQDKRYQDLLGALSDGIDAVGPDSPAGERLQETHDFFAYLAEEMPRLVERWRARRISEEGA